MKAYAKLQALQNTHLTLTQLRVVAALAMQHAGAIRGGSVSSGRFETMEGAI